MRQRPRLIKEYKELIASLPTNLFSFFKKEIKFLGVNSLKKRIQRLTGESDFLTEYEWDCYTRRVHSLGPVLTEFFGDGIRLTMEDKNKFSENEMVLYNRIKHGYRLKDDVE